MIILRVMHKVYISSDDEFAFHWRKFAFHQKKGFYNQCSNYNPKNLFANVFYYSINLVPQYVLDL